MVLVVIINVRMIVVVIKNVMLIMNVVMAMISTSKFSKSKWPGASCSTL